MNEHDFVAIPLKLKTTINSQFSNPLTRVRVAGPWSAITENKSADKTDRAHPQKGISYVRK